MMILFIDYSDESVEYIAVKYVKKQKDKVVYEQIRSHISRNIVTLDQKIRKITLQTEEGVLIQDLYFNRDRH